MLTFLLLSGCIIPDDTGPDDTADPRTCDDVVAEFAAESATIRTCVEPSECGQVLTGTSCGCTRNLVARNDADTTAFYALMAEANEMEGGTCDLGLTSTCDCPEAYGFDCVDAVCTWDYTERSEPYPDCRAEAGARYEVNAVALVGDTLTVSVSYGGGCEDHTFTTCWPDGSFMESSPVQASLELFHEDNDDACDAWLTEDVAVDLLPLKEAWQAAYAQSSGTIIVHLGGESVTYSF